jgi:DNA-binding NtrC family response regulator
MEEEREHMRTSTTNAERAAIHHERVHSGLSPGLETNHQEIVGDYLKGEHPLMRELRARLARHASGSSPVLLVGETGTGKQLAARALHAAGPRSGRSLVLASVGSLSTTLAQSELFGHRRGAFTGADRDRKGFFIEARGSTLILDDIPDYPLPVQAMLLSSVEYGVVRPVGSDIDEYSDARVVATANCSLTTEVEAGRFRKDLYYRLSGGEIRVPPLREHLSDLAIYAEAQLLRLALEEGRPPRVLSDGALNALSEHSWPGNVRELHNVLLKAIHATNSEKLLAEDVLRDIHPLRAAEAAAAPRAAAADSSRIEEMRVRAALENARWNVTKAAEILGFGRTWTYKLMAKYRIVR